jgi:hypothetical protein
MTIKHVLTTLAAGMLGLLIGACSTSSGQSTGPAPNLPTRNASQVPEVTDEELLDSTGTTGPASRPDDDLDVDETPDPDGTDVSEDESDDDSGSEEEFDFDEFEDDDD